MRQPATSSLVTRNDGAARLTPKWLVRLGPYGNAILGLSALVLLWLGVYHFTEQQRAHTLEGAHQNASNLARTFEENIIRSIRSVDQTLLYVRDLYAYDASRFDLSTWEKNQQFLTGLTIQVAIINARGVMMMSNIPGSVPGVDLTDREHFRFHVDRETDDLFISKPVLGRVSNKWTIQLTRKIIQPDGSFGGVVVVSLDPAYLSDFYRSIDIGEQGSITLVGRDGIVRARAARTPSDVAQSILESPLFDQLKQAEIGSYISPSRIDNVERLFVYRAVREFPLVVVVGLSMDEVFASFHKESTTTYVLAGLLSLWLLCVTGLISIYQRALGRAVREAEAGTRARSQFLATMSHEIRTPMNAIIGMIDVLQDSRLDATMRSYVQTMRDAADHLLKILNDILDFSKLDAGLFEVEQIAFEPQQMVESVVALARRAADEKGIAVEQTIAADLPPQLIGDPARVRQIVTNLLSNAIKFTQQGSIKISMRFVRRADGAGYLHIGVADTGIGIAPEAIPQLFQEFSQLDGSIARRFGGTGLGLAISKRLAERMGGTITVDSVLGAGTSFELSVPMAIAEPAKQETPPEPSVVAATQSRPRYDVLVVDDDPTNRLVASLSLERLGLTPKVVSNGQEAIDEWSAADYRVILMDVMMPEMDGLTATRKIREMSNGRQQPVVIALTANAFAGDREICLEAGMDDFISKPVTLVALRAKLIEEHLRPQSGDDETQFDPAKLEDLRKDLGDGATDILRTFGATIADRRSRLDAAMASTKIESVAREAHSLKSAAAVLGFAALASCAEQVERAAKQSHSDMLDHGLRRLRELMEAADIRIRVLQQPDARAA